MISKINGIMFDNIGRKIKIIAIVSAWIGIIVSILAGVATFLSTMIMFLPLIASNDFLSSLILLFVSLILSILGAAVVMIVGCLSSWLYVVLLYAFGQLVENSDETNENTALLYSIDKKIDTITHRVEPVVTDTATVHTQQKAACAPDNSIPANTESEEKNETSYAVPKVDSSLSKKLSFALKFQTDDGMINYLKTVKDETVQDILNDSPTHIVRARIKQLLDSM